MYYQTSWGKSWYFHQNRYCKDIGSDYLTLKFVWVVDGDISASTEGNLQFGHSCNTVDGRNPVNSPVEVGSFSHYLYRVRISAINSSFFHVQHIALRKMQKKQDKTTFFSPATTKTSNFVETTFRSKISYGQWVSHRQCHASTGSDMLRPPATFLTLEKPTKHPVFGRREIEIAPFKLEMMFWGFGNGCWTKNRGILPPKWMVKIMGKPYEQMDDLRVRTPIFGNTQINYG